MIPSPGPKKENIKWGNVHAAATKGMDIYLPSLISALRGTGEQKIRAIGKRLL